MEHEIFISYSSKNKTAADAICHVLENNELKCWMAPRDIPGGTDYGDIIDYAIKTSKVVVVIFSKTASSSQWVKGELNIAFDENKVIIPYRIDTTPLEGQNRLILNHKHWIDAYPDYKTKFKDLVKAVKIALGKQANIPKSEPPIPVKPGIVQVIYDGYWWWYNNKINDIKLTVNGKFYGKFKFSKPFTVDIPVYNEYIEIKADAGFFTFFPRKINLVVQAGSIVRINLKYHILLGVLSFKQLY